MAESNKLTKTVLKQKAEYIIQNINHLDTKTKEEIDMLIKSDEVGESARMISYGANRVDYNLTLIREENPDLIILIYNKIESKIKTLNTPVS